MTDEFQKRISDEFGVTLPFCYVAFMRSYPPELEATKLDLGRCQEAISERYFLKAPEGIAELNRGVRVPGVEWVEGEIGWPARFFVIGDDECGNYYAIDTDSDACTVHFYNHELGRFTVRAESLRAFADQMIEETLAFNQEKRHDAS